MSKHIWSIPCQTLLTDTLTNGVSYIQTIESYSVIQLPVVAPPITVGTLWARESGETGFQSRLRLIGPDNSLITVLENQLVVYGKNVRMRQTSVLGGFSYNLPGFYEILVEQRLGSEWRVECRLPIEIQQMSQDAFLDLQRQRVAAWTGAY